MSNIVKFAPYVYLAKRNGGGNTLYDLLLLVPVDATGDTDLSNVTANKPRVGTRISIDYSTNNNAANAPYRFKHWVIDSEGTYLDIKIQADNDPDRSMIIALSEADTEQAVVNNQQQTCAPYTFIRTESAGGKHYVQLSCVILFDNNLGVRSESTVFAKDKCTHVFIIGNNATSNPSDFVINQDIKMEVENNGEFTFEANIEGNTGLGKPPRKNKPKVLWP